MPFLILVFGFLATSFEQNGPMLRHNFLGGFLCLLRLFCQRLVVYLTTIFPPTQQCLHVIRIRLLLLFGFFFIFSVFLKNCCNHAYLKFVFILNQVDHILYIYRFVPFLSFFVLLSTLKITQLFLFYFIFTKNLK